MKLLKDFFAWFPRNKAQLGYVLGRKNKQGFPVRYDAWGREVNVPALQDYDWGGVIDPITRKQVVKWLADLRSGKFKQVTGSLKRIDPIDDTNTFACHCCLGVFADTNKMLNATVTSDDYDEYTEFTFDASLDPDYGSTSVLGSNGKYIDDGEDFFEGHMYVMPRLLQRRYYEMNDNDRMTFAQIADEIEKDFGIV